MFYTCPDCEKGETIVIDSREKKDSVRRRRKCLKCGFRYTTFEVRKEELDKLRADAELSDWEHKLRSIVKSYVNNLTAKQQTEFFDEIISR